MKTKTFFRFFLLGVMTLFTLGAWAQTETPDYLCFTATGASSVTLNKNGSPAEVTLQTSEDGTNWSDSDYAFGTAIELADGDKVYFRNAADGVTEFSTASWNYYQFAMTGSIAASGNVMSLVDKSVATTTIIIPCDYCFYRLFYNCTTLTNAADLKLPATELKSNCYGSMFYKCTGLKTAPALPATTLASSCYSSMFSGCTSLTTTPELPATTLASSCYGSMFSGCTGIEKAPALPATTLESYCYSYMFSGCTSLEAVPELPAMHLPDNCYNGMFRLCTKLIKAELPATTFENPQNGAYQYMFYGCNNLNYVKVAFTKWANTTQWLQDVASTGTFVCPAELDVTTRDADHVPAGWKVTYDITANQDPGNKENYYATFFTNRKAYQLPEGVTAYTAEVVGDVLKLKPIADGIIPANEGVVLKLTSTDDTEAKVHFLVEESTEAGTKDTGNALRGTDVKYTATIDDYALSLGTDGVGFYKWEGKEIGAHKAYLTLSSGAKAFVLDFDEGTTTAIESLTPTLSKGEGAIYNLNGVRVDDSYKGIVIKNGKKVLVK